MQFDPASRCCTECGSKLWGTSILFPLSQPVYKVHSTIFVKTDSPVCLGCSRLFSCIDNHKEKMDLITWIVRGKIDQRILKAKPHDSFLYNICQNRITQMLKRAATHFRQPPDNFVTAKELRDTVLSGNYHCCLVGSPMVLEHSKYNSLTFDHVFPISTSIDRPDCWSINNLQPMSFCMNRVKGNESNKEVRRWLLNFIRHYCEPALIS